jgi:hypothetical protein
MSITIGMSAAASTWAEWLGFYTSAQKPKLGSGASSEASGASLSPVAVMGMTQSISDLSYSANSTQCAYRSDDGSLAMQASSQVDIHTHTQRTDIQLTFSAEALGLTDADFQLTGGKPIQFDLGTLTSQTVVSASSSYSVNQTTKDVGQLLKELSGALTDILKKRGNKSISVALDDEAVRVLNSDVKLSKMIRELFTLISMLGQLQQGSGPSDHYAISLSGKGKPYVTSDQSLDVDTNVQESHLSLTILPPQAKSASVDA